MEPLISLIIPAYNVAPYLPQCLDSAIGQTYTPLEIIVVNDGSTDRTSEIINQYAAKDPRIVAVHQDNTGIFLVRKRAIEMAQGAYLCFLDGDDYIALDAIRTLYNGLTELGTDIVCGDLSRVSTDYTITKLEKWDGVIDGDTFMRYQLTNLMEGYLVAKLYKRELFEGLHFSADISMAEDKYMNIQIATKQPSVGHIPKNVYFYVKRGDSISHQTTPIEYNILLCSYIEQILHRAGCYDRFVPEIAVLQLKFYWLYICHTSSTDISRHPFVIRLHDKLAAPEIRKIMPHYFSATQRIIIATHRHRSTAWVGKILTTVLRISGSVAKRMGNEK